MIRYLTQDEKLRTKEMYQENFPEDSQAFVDYYYTYKTRDNQILVMEAEALEVMIHLNPYRFQICGEQAEINYIVAVATQESVRRQGKMACVLSQALLDMAKEHQPFTFLIPANPRVYLSAGFVFVPTEQYPEYEGQLIPRDRLAPADFREKAARQTQSLRAAELTGRKPELRKATEADIPAMVEFANGFLEEQYDIYPYRTDGYYRRMLEESACQNGGLALLEQGRELVGIFSYGQDEESAELQEILVLPEYQEQLFSLAQAFVGGDSFLPLAVTKMDFMVRILDIRVLCLMLRSPEPFTLKVQVEDDVIPANRGSYEIRADERGSSIRVISPEETHCAMDISQLTELLFGRMRTFIREWV